jgi:hypothetical protein
METQLLMSLKRKRGSLENRRLETKQLECQSRAEGSVQQMGEAEGKIPSGERS